MTEVTIRKVENGYILEHHHDDPYEDEGFEVYVAATDRDMIDHVTEVFFGGVLDIVKVETTSAEPVTDFEDEPARPQPNSLQEAETLAAAEALIAKSLRTAAKPLKPGPIDEDDLAWARSELNRRDSMVNGDAQDV